MLYVKLAADRAMADAKDRKEKQLKAMRRTQANEGAVKRGCGGGPPEEQGAVQASTSQPPVLSDSEWLGLSAEEQLAWAKNIQDPRIAVGSYSPLEKKIKSLGGIHSSEVRKLLAQEFQEENKALDKLKAMSFDFRFAKAEEYYYQRHQEMMMEEAWPHKMIARWQTEEEEKRPQSVKSDAKKWDYLVSERELNHIEKHIYRAEQARGLRDHKYRLLPQKIPSKMLPQKTVTLEDEKNIQKRHKTKTKKHKVTWAKEQMKGHRDRMIRGRELTEQRNNQRDAQKLSGQVPPLLKSQEEKEEAREFESVTAYPIFQPYKEALVEVTVLMEKAKEDKIQTPLSRQLLSIPPFLRSQLEKNKV